MNIPMDDKYLTGRKEMLSIITSLLGGRVAEELIFREITTGAQNDLERCTQIAKKMVCEFGMSEQLGPLTFGHGDQQVFLGRDISQGRGYSEEIAYEIDKEVRRIIEDCYQRCRNLLNENMERLHILAGALLEREVLDKDEVYRLLGIHPKEQKRPTEETATSVDDSVEEEEKAPQSRTQQEKKPGLLPPTAPETA